MIRDSKGRALRQNQPKPRWGNSPDFIGPCEHRSKSFYILQYQGFYRAPNRTKGQHKYAVACRFCGRTFTRLQGSIMRAELSDCKGCHHCAKERSKEEAKAARLMADKLIEESFQAWLWVLHSMRPTSLDFRETFDNEAVKLFGWRTI